MTEIKNYTAKYVDLPRRASHKTKRLLANISEKMLGGNMDIAIGFDGQYDAVVHLHSRMQRNLLMVMFNVFYDANNLVVDVEKANLTDETQQGLGTWGIYQAALATLPEIAKVYQSNSVRMILDDANFGYNWEKLKDLFPPERESMSLDLGDGSISTFSYHQFNF